MAYVKAGERLRQEREARGWIRRDLAARVSKYMDSQVHQQTILKLEAGTMKMSEKWLEAFGKAFGMAPADFLRPAQLTSGDKDRDASIETTRAKANPSSQSPNVEAQQPVVDDDDIKTEVRPAVEASPASAEKLIVEAEATSKTGSGAISLLNRTEGQRLLKPGDTGLNRLGSGGDTYLVVDTKDRDLRHGRYYVIKVDGKLVGRRYGSNPARFEPFSLDFHETLYPFGPVEIVGRVLGSIVDLGD
jgi:transcriptional regulator with XRE-family HTH domain